ncbi:MAG: UDP-N-acetylglucosamine 2-epimerase [Phycisphaerales bacterium]
MTRPDAAWRIAVVTGSRADFGLLKPVMAAILAMDALELQVVMTGTHLLPEVDSRVDVEAEFEIAARVEMQRVGRTGRTEDAVALGRGIEGLARAFERLRSDVVLVLGDRIEAMAAASAASIGGRLVAHIHGGDRAEGVADEAMRHAITKLSHIHLTATAESRERILRMGEDPEWTLQVGSPAIDDLVSMSPLPDEELIAWEIDPKRPLLLVLHHPSGLPELEERRTIEAILKATNPRDDGVQRLLLAPNHDPGREVILKAIGTLPMLGHLDRPRFVGLLRRAAAIVGNSSAGLIEAAALGVPAVNVGPRQAGRERPVTVVDVAGADAEEIRRAINQAIGDRTDSVAHPYGDGRSSDRIVEVLLRARKKPPSTRKRCQY